MDYDFDNTPSFSDDDLDGLPDAFAMNAQGAFVPCDYLPCWGGPLDGRYHGAHVRGPVVPQCTPDDGPIWAAFGTDARGEYVREGQRLRWVAR